MNVTFLIGNGFDVNLGLKTKYTDFYGIYKDSNKNLDENDCIKKFSEKILEIPDIETWSDFESAFAKTIEGSQEEIRDILYDFSTKFSDYLREQLNHCDYSNKDIPELLRIFLTEGYKNLEKRDKGIIANKYSACKREDIVINFINFNYTNTLENIIKKYKENNSNSTTLRSYTWGNEKYREYINKTLNIHGDLNDFIIIGIGELAQIKNEALKNNESLGKYCVKSEINFDTGNEEREKQFTDTINSSNIIYSYGISFGLSDINRWRILHKWLTTNPEHKLIIYKFDPKFKKYRKEYPRKLLDDIDKSKDEHLCKLGFDVNEYEKYYSQIFVIDSADVLNFKLANCEDDETDKSKELAIVV